MTRLEEIRERWEKATPGPWKADDFGYAGMEEPCSIVIHTGKFDWQDINGEGESVIASMFWDSQEADNAAAIAHAREDVPWLLEQMSHARERVHALSHEVDRLSPKCDCAGSLIETNAHEAHCATYRDPEKERDEAVAEVNRLKARAVLDVSALQAETERATKAEAEAQAWKEQADINVFRGRLQKVEEKLRDPWGLEGNAAAQAWKKRVDAVQAWAEQEYGDASEFPTGLVFALFGSVAAELHEVGASDDGS